MWSSINHPLTQNLSPNPLSSNYSPVSEFYQEWVSPVSLVSVRGFFHMFLLASSTKSKKKTRRFPWKNLVSTPEFPTAFLVGFVLTFPCYYQSYKFNQTAPKAEGSKRMLEIRAGDRLSFWADGPLPEVKQKMLLNYWVACQVAICGLIPSPFELGSVIRKWQCLPKYKLKKLLSVLLW